jgi:hypothetical protein
MQQYHHNYSYKFGGVATSSSAPNYFLPVFNHEEIDCELGIVNTRHFQPSVTEKQLALQ